ncbi:MAG: dicarboxylate/amino acid:cation symporter [Gammaproteobacteria bacterium]|nr:MAG: dicarboxylate/amino acid:cation symporter [Gammaproteobacteria bacterium]
MQNKLVAMNVFAKITLIAILLAASVFGMNSPYQFVGYVLLFSSLYVINEGFNFSLFTKILLALVLGILIASAGIFNGEDLEAIRPVGSKIFMNCLTMALVPLVFSSIVTGVTNLGDIKKLNQIGIRTITYYIITTAIAISIGLVLANFFQPGKNLDTETRAQFEQTFKSSATAKVHQAEENKQSLFEGLQAIFPSNIFASISKDKPQMLQLIFFAVMCGIALLQIEAKHSEPVIKLFTGVTEMTVKIIMMVMRLAPYGVFALIASTVAGTQGAGLLLTLIPFSLIVVAALLIHGIGTNSLSLIFLSKKKPLWFFSKIKSVAITAFSTSSSAATMPLTLEVVEDKLKVKNEVAGFVIPLGATINMDGTALFQGVSAIFLANIYGIDLTFADQLTVVGMAVMASIGTAAVPGVGIVILTMILVSIGVPAEGILFILPVNNLLDMCRSSTNVLGDMACAVYIDSKVATVPSN